MDRFEAFKDMDGRWRWRLMVGNERVIASSKAGFDTQGEALRAAEIVKTGAAGAPIAESAGLGPREFIARLIRREEARRLEPDAKSRRPRATRSSRLRRRATDRPLSPLRPVGSRRPA